MDFSKHSLKNYSTHDINSWIEDGIERVSKIMDIEKEELKKSIEFQEKIMAFRALAPTIDINTPARQQLREQILNDYENLYPNAVADRKATIVLGQIASGKSTFSRILENNGKNIIVDVDFIKQGHASMQGLKKDFDDGRGSDQIHEEASMLSKKFLNRISDYGYNLIVPKAGTEYGSIKKIAETLKGKGYDVQLVYIDLPIKKCIERNFKRFVDESQRGIPSRLIPISTIKMIDDKPFKTFCKFLRENSPLIDNFSAYTNDSDAYEFIPLDLYDMLLFDMEDEDKVEILSQEC